MSANKVNSETDWADDVDYVRCNLLSLSYPQNTNDLKMNDYKFIMNDQGDDDDDEEMDVDYGDDDDEDSIGDLNLSSDDPELPAESGGVGIRNDIKYEITSGLHNPNRIGVSHELRIDTKDTPGDISDDDMAAPGLRINQFQLITSDDKNEGIP